MKKKSFLFQILYDFKLLFEHINDNALEQKWDALHNKPLSEFKDFVSMDKIPTTDVKIWQMMTTFKRLKPRGGVWKFAKSLITFSEV